MSLAGKILLIALKTTAARTTQWGKTTDTDPTKAASRTATIATHITKGAIRVLLDTDQIREEIFLATFEGALANVLGNSKILDQFNPDNPENAQEIGEAASRYAKAAAQIIAEQLSQAKQS
jgi:hypothetical protein